MATIRVSEAVHRAAKVRAAAGGVSLRSVVEAALVRFAGAEDAGSAAAGAISHGACAACGHALSQHAVGKGTTTRFCRVAGCACRVR